jgi:hypothetical protein
MSIILQQLVKTELEINAYYKSCEWIYLSFILVMCKKKAAAVLCSE